MGWFRKYLSDMHKEASDSKEAYITYIFFFAHMKFEPATLPAYWGQKNLVAVLVDS